MNHTMGELSPGASVAIGVLVGLVSTTIQSIGLTLQRKSHMLEDEKEDEHARRPPYRRRRWQIGMATFLTANIVGSTFQLTTLPLPVLSTLQASGLVFNTMCATLLLKEPFTRYSLVGTILVAAGAVLIGIFGAMTEPSHNLQQLLDLLGRGNFLIWLFMTFFFATGFALAALFSHSIWPHGHPRIRLMQGMMFGAVSGILSAHLLLVAKLAVELIVRTIVDQNNQFVRWQSWLILLALITLALSQIFFLHSGLKLCSTSVLYPLVFCVYNIIAILDGLIYFHQTSRLTPLHAGLIALGTVVLLVGVFALSWRLEEPSTYRAVPGSDGGSTRRVRSMSRLATPTMPQTVLAPGMGIVEGSSGTVDAEEVDEADHSDNRRYDDDEESGLHIARKQKSKANERTPLMRRTTTPNSLQPPAQNLGNHQLDDGNNSLQVSKRRKTITAPSATAELWNELIENDVYRRRSMDFGTSSAKLEPGLLTPKRISKSPSSVRFHDRPTSSSSGRARRAEADPSRRAYRGSGSQYWNVPKWRFWENLSPAYRGDLRGAESKPSNGDRSEEPLIATSSQPRSNSAMAAGSADDQRPTEWLNLNWWRKRWKGKDIERNEDWA